MPGRKDSTVRAVARIALGTALGILLSGVVGAVAFVFLIDRTDGAESSPPRVALAETRSAVQRDDIDGDGRPDASDPDPYSANSSSYETAKLKPPRVRESRPGRAEESSFVACDPNISVRAATTTCAFAQNVFFQYWASGGTDRFRAYSPASEQVYRLSCKSGGTVVCTAGDGAEVRFGSHAVALYDQDQADAYAATHDLGPVEAADTDAYSADDDYGDESAESGYDDGDGLTEPGENIPYYEEGDGYRVQCADGTYSQSGGIQGACSHHGGIG